MVKIMMLGRVATLRSSSAAFYRRSRAARVGDSEIPSFYPKD